MDINTQDIWLTINVTLLLGDDVGRRVVSVVVFGGTVVETEIKFIITPTINTSSYK